MSPDSPKPATRRPFSHGHLSVIGPEIPLQNSNGSKVYAGKHSYGLLEEQMMLEAGNTASTDEPAGPPSH
jgi:hypothetical protein